MAYISLPITHSLLIRAVLGSHSCHIHYAPCERYRYASSPPRGRLTAYPSDDILVFMQLLYTGSDPVKKLRSNRQKRQKQIKEPYAYANPWRHTTHVQSLQIMYRGKGVTTL